MSIKKITKRVISLVVSMLMVIGMMPLAVAPVYAASYEARIDGTYYSKLQDALDNVNDGQIIQVLKDVSNTTAYRIERGKSFTLGIYDHSITTTGSTYGALFIKNGDGEVSIIGASVIGGRDGGILEGESRALTLTSGKVNLSGPIEYTSSGTTAVRVNGGVLTVNSGTFRGSFSTNEVSGVEPGEIIIKDGEFWGNITATKAKSLEIQGGTFLTSKITNTGKTGFITGGLFLFYNKPNENYLDPNYHFVNSSVTYTYGGETATELAYKVEKIPPSVSLTPASGSIVYDPAGEGTEVTAKLVDSDKTTEINAGSYKWYKGDELISESKTVTLNTPGTYKAVLNYNGVNYEAEYKVLPADISSGYTTSIPGNVTYKGSRYGEEFIKDNVILQKSGSSDAIDDFTFEVTSAGENTNAGTGAGTYTIKGTDNYTGTLSGTFDIAQADFSKAEFTLNPTSAVYTGEEIMPKLTGTFNVGTAEAPENINIDSSEYTYTYNANVDAGTASVRIESKNINFTTGSKDLTFEITKAENKATVAIDDWVHGDSVSTPQVTADFGADTATFEYKVKGADDSTYASTVPSEVGEYTVKAIVPGTSNYKPAEATCDFEIISKKYSVTFDANGGKGTKEAETIEENSSYMLPAADTFGAPEGMCRLKSWEVTIGSAEPVTKAPGETITISDDTVVKAVYEAHDWNEPTYAWTDNNNSVTATRICKHDASHVENETAVTAPEVTKEATCESKGESTYTAKFQNAAFAEQTKTVVNIDALGHSWGTPTYEWSADNKTVTATRVCGRDGGHVETEMVNTTSEVTKEAACETKGETTYTSAAFTNTAFAVQTKTIGNIDALSHNWGEPTYEWSSDNKTVTATRVCGHDSKHVETETVSTTSEVTKEATCDAKGETTYTSATFTNTAFVVQSKTVADIDVLNHSWGKPTYEWSADNKTVTATRVCGRDGGHVETEMVNTTSEVTKNATCDAKGETTYTAKFQNAAFAEQTKTVVNIDALNHSWGKPTYEWSSDNKTVTATRVCVRDSEHVETETVSTTSEVTQNATCETGGETTYTSAAFTNTAFAVQTKTIGNIEALSHNWCEPTYEWSADNKTVTATRVCKNNEEHIEKETANVTSEITKPATCTTKGETTYTSDAFENEAFETQSKTVDDVEIDSNAHEWKAPTYEWSSDNKTVTATRTCKHDASHVETETVETSCEVTKEATETEMGEEVYTAQFASAVFETQTKTKNIPEKEHEHSLEKVEAKDATCEEDGNIEYWKCNSCGELFMDSEGAEGIASSEIVIKAFDHDWTEPTYEWTEDNSKVTATRTCKHDASHVETETVTTKSQVTKEATETEEGETTYTASFSNPVFSMQTKKEPIAKLDPPVNPEPTTPVDPEPSEPTTPVDPEPSEPTTPDDPKPSEPTTPDDPNSSEPTTPDDPKPSEPTTPVDPKPSEPTTPVDPKPSEPTTPVDPKPSEPTTPVDPKPSEPTTPVDPEPSDPTTPVNPKPSEPTTPVDPKPSDPIDDEITYRNIEGDGAVWIKDSTADTPRFTFKRSDDDSQTFSCFVGVKVDDVEVDNDNYTAEPGSVIIKLKPEYLDTLAPGEHKLTALFKDRNDVSEVSVGFKIEGDVEPTTPVEPEPGEPTTPVEPEPGEPTTPVEPEPSEPTTPVEPGTDEPTDPTPSEPAPEDKPTEPGPEDKPADTKPTDGEPTDTKPVDTKPTDTNPTDTKTDSKADSTKPTSGTETKADNAKATGTATGVAKTGDANDIALWTSLVGIVAAIIVELFFRRKDSNR